MKSSLPRRRAERRGLRLWPVGAVLALAFTAAVAVAAAVFFAGWVLLGAQSLEPKQRVPAQTLFDLVKLSFGVVAGTGALVALVVAYRRQRVDEDGALRESTRLHTERFTTAVSQLGEDSVAVRLGGVHALAGLADDAPTLELRQTCIDVLCAYLRLPYTLEAELPSDDTEARREYRALREVRHTITRVIRDHLRLPPGHPDSWQGHNFDFSGATFDGGDFSSAIFSSGKVSFKGAVFAAGMINLRYTVFSGGTVSFNDAVFAAGTVDFSSAAFCGNSAVVFTNATFSGGMATFDKAVFSSTVSFAHSAFSGARVDFRNSRFVNDDRGVRVVTWDMDGTTIVNDTLSCGGAVSFLRASFAAGLITFHGALFFRPAAVGFEHAAFSGGMIDLSHASGGPAPAALVPAEGSPLPTGLLLPSAWFPTTN